jgi:hypothetical protein
MSEDVYRKLAQRLDAIPNGFPATQSGVELRLLAKMFTPDEAGLACVMRLSHESATDIAARNGMAPDLARLEATVGEEGILAIEIPRRPYSDLLHEFLGWSEGLFLVDPALPTPSHPCTGSSPSRRPFPLT